MKKSDIRQFIREALAAELYEADEAPSDKKKDTPDETTPPAPQADGVAARDVAHDLGLQYAGWSEWKDKTGDTVAKTIGDKLVKLDKTGVDSAAKMDDPYAANAP